MFSFEKKNQKTFGTCAIPKGIKFFCFFSKEKKTFITAFLTALLLCIAQPAAAALKDGSTAPDFTTQATLGGKEFTFSLADALKHGPVVLYFYPAAFTQGCTEEAHDFADAIDHYTALGATVVGVSGDSIATLDKFSVSECQSKFAVAADPKRVVMKAYDAVLIPPAVLRRPHILRHHARPQGDLQLHGAGPRRSCGQHHGRPGRMAIRPKAITVVCFFSTEKKAFPSYKAPKAGGGIRRCDAAS